MTTPLFIALLALTAALSAILTFAGIRIAIARKRPRKARKTSNTVLIILGLFVLVFIVTMIITYWRFRSVPDSLIQYTLGAGGIETVALAAIKISKTFKGGNKDE